MASMTCLACNVAFEDVDLGRLHYKTDWHRYNLKRKVANFAPVTLEQFQERQKLQDKQDKQANTTEGVCLQCKPCNKVFSSTNAYDNHLQSKKHKDVLSGAHDKRKKGKKGKKQRGPEQAGAFQASNNISAVTEQKSAVDNGEEEMDDDSDAESYDSYDENMIGIEECLFCSHISKSLEDNVKHMTSKHGFFLPDAQYIVDLEGLITYLGEKVGAGHVCLWCNKMFSTTKDVQRHMIDKGHCKMLHEGDAIFEYADYYDYSPSYPDGQEPGIHPDEVVNIAELESDGYSLTLPSGATIGHRSLVHFYQQNMIPYNNRESSKRILPKMLAHYKALGWTGATGPQVAHRAKDLQFMKRMRSKYHMQLGCKANHLQKHFRDPNGP